MSKQWSIKVLFGFLFALFITYHISGQEWNIQTTVLSTLQYSEFSFRDSGWYAGVPNGLKIPVEFQTGIIRTKMDILITLIMGLSLGILPDSMGYYSGATLGVGLHYNGKLQGFYNAVYPLADTTWLQIGQNKRDLIWQSAIDIFGFTFDFTSVPLHIGGYLRSTFDLSSLLLVTPDIGVTIGYYYK
jgi:hypothetical protein